ncbi:MAG: PIG-L family deacetylase [Kiritimatiellae bacterium]|nr:PIG-L family deacetylase [Kiritimatiellia bacterium]
MNDAWKMKIAAVVCGLLAPLGAVRGAPLDRVVFLGAHPDDLASEMGTAVLMKGVYEMHVIDYTHGEWGCGEEKATNGWTKAKRTQEETDVCRSLGAALHWLDEVDGHAYAGKDSTARLAALLKEIKPRAVIMHWPICDHPDHVMCFAAGMKALHLAGLFDKTEVYFHHQQHQNRNFQPRIYVDISSVMDERNRLIELYECQDGGYMADYKEKAGRVFGKMTGRPDACLESYSLMSGTSGPGRCIFDKLPQAGY